MELINNKPTFSLSTDILQLHFVRDLPQSAIGDSVMINFDYLGLYQNPQILLLEVYSNQVYYLYIVLISLITCPRLSF